MSTFYTSILLLYSPEFKGRLSASEMITGFLQFHALVHLCTGKLSFIQYIQIYLTRFVTLFLIGC